MFAAAARCIRVLPRSRLPPVAQPALALRARALPVRALASRSVFAAAMDGSDAESKAAQAHAAAAAAGDEAAPAPAAAKPRARKAPAAKEKASGDAEGLTAEEKAEEKAQKKAKADAEKTVLPSSDTPRKPPPAGCVRCLRPASRGLRTLGSRRAFAPAAASPNNSPGAQAVVQGAVLERCGPSRRAEQRHRRGAAAPGGRRSTRRHLPAGACLSMRSRHALR